MRYGRIATTQTQQIETLFSRNLDIIDDVGTKQKLANIGYFKFKGYCIPFYDGVDHFKNGTTFDKIYQAYIVDQKLHHYLMGISNRIETQIKSKLGSYIALKQAPLAHYDSNFFKSDVYKEEWLTELKKNEENAIKRHELYTNHYRDKYDDQFPIWVALEMSTFGSVSKLFSDMNVDLKKSFSSECFDVPYVYIESWLHFLTVVRNCSAHNNRTFEKSYAVDPRISRREKNNCKELNDSTIFSALYVMKKMCSSKIFFNDVIKNIDNVFKSYELVDEKSFGFPKDWLSFCKVDLA